MAKRTAKDRTALVTRGAGRPTTFTEEVADVILARLAAGESLRSICEPDDGPAPLRTVFGWLAANEDFSTKYTRAREAQADLHAADCIPIADDAAETPDGVRKAELRIKTRQWYAAKLRPKVYGEPEKAAPGVVINNLQDNRALTFRDRM